MTERPRRRWTIELVSGGDTFEDASVLLLEMAEHLEEHGAQCDLVHGGARSGGFVRVTENPSMTPAKYVEALDAWLESRSAKAEGRASSHAKTVAEVLDATEAVIRDGEVDLDEVTTPEKAREALLELVAHIRDQLCDVLLDAEAGDSSGEGQGGGESP